MLAGQPLVLLRPVSGQLGIARLPGISRLGAGGSHFIRAGKSANSHDGQRRVGAHGVARRHQRYFIELGVGALGVHHVLAAIAPLGKEQNRGKR